MRHRFTTACGQPPWHLVEKGDLRCLVRGNIFLEDRLSPPAAIAARLSKLLDDPLNADDLRRTLLQMNGEYAVVLDTPDTGLLFADRVRSIPLFYAHDSGGLTVTDSAYTLKNSMNPDYIEENGAEFLTTGFVTGSGTLYAGIRQLQAGEYLIYDKLTGRLQSAFYHHFLHGNFSLLPEDRLIEELDTVMAQSVMRLRKTTGGRQIVVPLSGGLDSRIIAALLFRLGVRDAVCYTYGKRDDREAAISRQVAEELGYEWHFVEYSKKMLYTSQHSPEMRKHLEFSGNLASVPHIQDFYAVMEMKREGTVPDDSVFVPGHTGDMLSGGHIPDRYCGGNGFTRETALADILSEHYSLWNWAGNPVLRHIFRNRVLGVIGSLPVTDAESCANAVEFFDSRERQAKYILQSLGVYDHFGYGWRIPLWDAGLIDFFLAVPLRLRVRQRLYKNYAFYRLFSGELEGLRSIGCTTGGAPGGTTPAEQRSGTLLAGSGRLLANLTDARWERYFRRPLIGRLCVRSVVRRHPATRTHPLIRSLVGDGCPLPTLVSLGGYQTFTMLADILDGDAHARGQDPPETP